MFIDHHNFTAEALPMYSRAADVYEQMAAAFEKFEQMLEDSGRECEYGFSPFPGDVAIGCKRYAEHLRAVCQYASKEDVEFAAAFDFEHGESIQQFLDCMIGEFADGYHDFALGCDATRSPLDGGSAA